MLEECENHEKDILERMTKENSRHERKGTLIKGTMSCISMLRMRSGLEPVSMPIQWYLMNQECLVCD
jgi:hypothetical protein